MSIRRYHCSHSPHTITECLQSKSPMLGAGDEAGEGHSPVLRGRGRGGAKRHVSRIEYAIQVVRSSDLAVPTPPPRYLYTLRLHLSVKWQY